jgi:very-short-patch-repair endonuclease
MTKDEYILRSFSKIKHKKWELFVITRIIHKLNDPDIEYVCQQYINIPGNSHHLCDLCFPSLKIYYEIDEGQHATSEHKESDKKRTQEILNITHSHEYKNKIKQRETLEATDWIVKRIRVYDKSRPDLNRDINEVMNEVDQFVEFLRERKKKFEKKLNKKIVWDYENKFKPQKYIDSGSISVDENVVFRYISDCLKLFGYTSDSSPQTGWWEKGTAHLNHAVWLPKLYENKDWDNRITDDGLTIYEKSKKEHLKITDFKEKPIRDRIVFAHYKNIFGHTVYKFYGIFRTDMELSDNLEHVHRRIGTKINLKDYYINE